MANIKIEFSRFSAFYSPLILTMASGFLKREGFEPRYSISKPGKSAVESLLDGSVHVVQSAPSQTFASLEKGEKIYKKCGACHNYEKESKSKVGPNLWNIINRLKASTEGFAYSKALSEFGGKWNYEELNNFLYKTKEYIKGTKMNFAGLKNVQDRADLILFLRQQSDNPFPLP